MGGQQSNERKSWDDVYDVTGTDIQKAGITNERRSTMPPQRPSPNSITCQNFDFAANGFACPDASVGYDGMCNCGPHCTPLGGTCCKSVAYDQGTRSWKCEELSGMKTKGPSVLQPGVTTQPLPVYDPNNLDQTYHPILETTVPAFVENECGVSDKTYQGITIPGSAICNWYEQA